MGEENFEAAMKRLEEIVKRLEGGDMSLGQSLQAFEEGMQLAGYCSSELERAEKKVSLLVKESAGNYRETPFSADGESSGESHEL